MKDSKKECNLNMKKNLLYFSTISTSTLFLLLNEQFPDLVSGGILHYGDPALEQVLPRFRCSENIRTYNQANSERKRGRKCESERGFEAERNYQEIVLRFNINHLPNILHINFNTLSQYYTTPHTNKTYYTLSAQ
jgi:hypothetical protein